MPSSGKPAQAGCTNFGQMLVDSPHSLAFTLHNEVVFFVDEKNKSSKNILVL
jgi:hypothetical protein